ncbi:MAG: MAPEG family protein [Burkholderiaceae bacterium]
MYLVEIVTLIALLQFMLFGFQVGRARGKFGVKAPAVSGNEDFERVYRVQMNTLELLVLFLPSMWIAAQYVPPSVAAGLGCLYLIGRVLYSLAYKTNPSKRSAGFLLSICPIFVLILIGLAGAFGAAVAA